MIYLSGTTSDQIEAALIARGIGLIATPNTGYKIDRISRFRYWAADNGCYSARWEETRWLTWLDRLPRAGCLFAVAPDVYPDAVATLERSTEYFELVRDMGFPVALVAQDGAENLHLPWDDFDCLFVGGKKTPRSRDEWKLSTAAAGLVLEARNRGLWVHMGRVNSRTRMARAREMGVHSCDGTFIAKAPLKNLPRVDVWYEWLDRNPMLPYQNFESPSLPVHRDALL